MVFVYGVLFSFLRVWTLAIFVLSTANFVHSISIFGAKNNKVSTIKTAFTSGDSNYCVYRAYNAFFLQKMFSIYFIGNNINNLVIKFIFILERWWLHNTLINSVKWFFREQNDFFYKQQSYEKSIFFYSTDRKGSI